ncbi:PfkB family carbohydrate kinase, partial [Paraburkholderia sp.]|uniref:carbohydrate kinase family protein n=1 Tax=Paraburkholderia sp. TaxID=1926495 RepID=UPI00286EF1BA
KLGADGAYFETAEGVYGHVPARRVEKVVDTVGAGDGFAVGVVSALLEGRPLPEAVARGNRIGALAVQVIGDSEGLPTREQLDALEARDAEQAAQAATPAAPATPAHAA